jgi:hypothetical protein
MTAIASFAKIIGYCDPAKLTVAIEHDLVHQSSSHPTTKEAGTLTPA